MTIGWGWKIGLLYTGFAAMIICLVFASNKQKIDLVSKDYYKDEIAYQQVLDASKNQAGLNGALSVYANASNVVIDFPGDFTSKQLSGNVTLYSAVNQDWDKRIPISTSDNKMMIPRKDLQHTIYTVKVNYKADGKDFYYETQIDLHAS